MDLNTNHLERSHPDKALSRADAEAVDAFVDQVPSADHARYAKVSKLLSLLGQGVPLPDRHSRVDVTMARVLKAHAEDVRSMAIESTLIPDDQEALEAWMNEGQDVRRVPGSLRERARKIEQLSALIQAGGSGVARSESEPILLEQTAGMSARDRRIDRVMAQLNASPASADAPQLRLSGADAGAAVRHGGAIRTKARMASREELLRVGSRGLGFGARDIASAAAVVLIGFSVLWPMLSAARSHSSQQACASNLSSIASALASYGNDFRGAFPAATASLGGSWWNVGEIGNSNSANLVVMPRNGYGSLEDFACPGNPAACTEAQVLSQGDWACLEQVSYSFRIPSAESRNARSWNVSGNSILLADCSPVVRRARAGQVIYAAENSPNHAGQGQRALRHDGSAVWMSSPMAGRDNIWLPQFIEVALNKVDGEIRQGRTSGRITIQGSELPNANDIMLGP